MNGDPVNLISTFIPPPPDAHAVRAEALKQAFKKKFGDLLNSGPLVVMIRHEPFLPWFVLEFNGQTEELDHMECLDWFREHGATDEDLVNNAISQAFNFHAAELTIAKPKYPSKGEIPGVTPRI